LECDVPEPLAPLPDAFSIAYWDAAREGRLLIQQCTRCRRYQFYPRQHCAACLAANPEWVTAGGRGTLQSYTIVHRTPNSEFAARTPYIFALVDLDEGVRITANIIDVGDHRLRCGDRVRIVFTPMADDLVLPCATVDSEGADAAP
jgi:uncharacterized OB-fold protein